MAVSDWQTTADDNTDVDGIDISKGFPARNVGAAFRNIMADTKAALDRSSFCGEIRQFYGTLDSDGHPIPLDWAEKGITTGLSNWHVCDGTSGTPDMRGRVAVGMTDSNTLGEALGSDTVTPTITIGATAQQTSLSATTLGYSQMPSHNHRFSVELYNAGAGTANKNYVNWGTSHGSDNLFKRMDLAGASASHTHAVTNPTHIHKASSSALSTYQPSRALYMIMRTA